MVGTASVDGLREVLDAAGGDVGEVRRPKLADYDVLSIAIDYLGRTALTPAELVQCVEDMDTYRVLHSIPVFASSPPFRGVDPEDDWAATESLAGTPQGIFEGILAGAIVWAEERRLIAPVEGTEQGDPAFIGGAVVSSLQIMQLKMLAGPQPSMGLKL